MLERSESLMGSNPSGQLNSGSQTNVWDNLEPNKQLVAIHYAGTGSWAEAARKVGVSADTARKWGKDVRVLALVNHCLAQVPSLVSRPMLERMQLDVYAMAVGEEDSHGVDKDGATWSAPVTNLPAANQAIANLHRMSVEDRKIVVEERKAGSGQRQVTLSFGRENADPDRHFKMLQQRQDSVDVDASGDIDG